MKDDERKPLSLPAKSNERSNTQVLTGCFQSSRATFTLKSIFGSGSQLVGP